MQLKQKMPPKGNQPSTKTIQKEKQKIIEDRTFGLKNKNKSKRFKSTSNKSQKTFRMPDIRVRHKTVSSSRRLS